MRADTNFGKMVLVGVSCIVAWRVDFLGLCLSVPLCTHLVCHRSLPDADATQDRDCRMVCGGVAVVGSLLGHGGSRCSLWLFVFTSSLKLWPLTPARNE